MLQKMCVTRDYMKSLNIPASSCNRCFGQEIHELTEIVWDFRKSLKLLIEN